MEKALLAALAAIAGFYVGRHLFVTMVHDEDDGTFGLDVDWQHVQPWMITGED